MAEIRLMGADASDELAKLVLDEFSFKIRAAAESSQKGLSAKDVEGLIDDFMEKGRYKTLVNFQERFELTLREHERDIWDRTRARPFERVLIQRFCHLFPSEGELHDAEGAVSRRMIPGFLKAIEQLVGHLHYKRLCHECKAIITLMKRQKLKEFRWYDIYDDHNANALIDEALAVVALTFVDFEKNLNWLLSIINAELEVAEFYAFEGEAVDSWELDRIGLIKVLRGLYVPFAKWSGEKINDRKQIERLYGVHSAAAIRSILLSLEPDTANV